MHVIEICVLMCIKNEFCKESLRNAEIWMGFQEWLEKKGGGVLSSLISTRECKKTGGQKIQSTNS